MQRASTVPPQMAPIVEVNLLSKRLLERAERQPEPAVDAESHGQRLVAMSRAEAMCAPPLHTEWKRQGKGGGRAEGRQKQGRRAERP
eukprot:1761749-Pleurochrysis_carterae.AAC.1